MMEPAALHLCFCRTCHGDLYLAVDPDTGKRYGACKGCMTAIELQDPGPVAKGEKHIPI